MQGGRKSSGGANSSAGSSKHMNPSSGLGGIPKSDDTIVIGPAPNSKCGATLIFLHGLGDTGNGWSTTLAPVKPPFMKLICPTANVRPVTLNGGMSMHAWYDIKSMNLDGPQDEIGISESAVAIRKIIDDEVNTGLPANRIFLGGFSQGGSLALYAGLTSNHIIGGIICLSGWLPLHHTFPWPRIQPTIPIMLCHGDADPMVPARYANLTCMTLKTIMKNVELHIIAGLTHGSNEQELRHVTRFLEELVPAPDSEDGEKDTQNEEPQPERPRPKFLQWLCLIPRWSLRCFPYRNRQHRD